MTRGFHNKIPDLMDVYSINGVTGITEMIGAQAWTPLFLVKNT
jgi:hypothetical protein